MCLVVLIVSLTVNVFVCLFVIKDKSVMEAAAYKYIHIENYIFQQITLIYIYICNVSLLNFSLWISLLLSLCPLSTHNSRHQRPVSNCVLMNDMATHRPRWIYVANNQRCDWGVYVSPSQFRDVEIRLLKISLQNSCRLLTVSVHLAVASRS